MSFAFHITTTPADVGRVRQAVVDEYLRSGADEHANAAGVPTETRDLVDAGADVVWRLVAALGSGWAEAHVAVSGHANPGHAERAGWATDAVRVAVVVSKYRAVEPVEPVEAGTPAT